MIPYTGQLFFQLIRISQLIHISHHQYSQHILAQVMAAALTIPAFAFGVGTVIVGIGTEKILEDGWDKAKDFFGSWFDKRDLNVALNPSTPVLVAWNTTNLRGQDLANLSNMTMEWDGKDGAVLKTKKYEVNGTASIQVRCYSLYSH